MKNSRFFFQPIVLYIVTFLMGGIGVAYEYTFSKLASDLLGNSVQQWAIVIGIMMLCMGVGSDIQKYIKDEHIFDRFVFFEVILGLAGGFGPIVLLFIFGHSRDHFAVAQYSLTILIGLLIGIEIPVLTRINESHTPLLKINLGSVLRMDYTGAFAGALMWIFLLPLFFTILETGFFLGFLNIVTAAVFLVFYYNNLQKKRLLSWFIVAGMIAVTAGGFLAPKWSAAAEQRLFRDKIVFSATTPYQHIVMTKKPTGDLFCYINGNLQFSSSDEYIYHELLVHPAMHLAPCRKHVLVLGGGDGLAVREILRYPDVMSVSVVDIDPAMTELARTNPLLREINGGSFDNAKVVNIKNKAVAPGGKENVYQKDWRYINGIFGDSVAEVNILNLDAAKFVDQSPGVYDVIVIDFPDPSSIELSKLFSRSFYRNVASKLSRNGVVTVQSTSPFVVNDAYRCIGATMKAAGFNVVPYHVNVPTFGDWGYWIGMHGSVSDSAGIVSELNAVDSIIVPVRYITPSVIKASLVFGKNSFGATPVDTNTILNNVLFRYYRKGLEFAY